MKDWRLQGQEEYLRGKALRFEKYKMPGKDWDHDHCEFCYEKFSETDEPGSVTEGYVTKDRHRWICGTCYNDFKELFGWETDSDRKGPG